MCITKSASFIGEMKFSNYLLLYFLLICRTLDSTEAHDEYNNSLRDDMAKEIDSLKSANEILKLRLENLELKMDNRITNSEYKIQAIEDHVNNLGGIQRSSMTHQTVESRLQDPHEISNNYQNTENNSRTSKTFSENPQPLELVEAEYDVMTYIDIVFLDEPRICVENEQLQFVCSNITLPNSCSTSNSMNCYENKCRIKNHLLGRKSFLVPCDFTTDDGGWIVIQRRVNGSVDFYRNWSEYKQGFGDLDGNYWIGLEKLHALTTALAPVELRVDLQDFDNVKKYAKYDSFGIGDERSMYVLNNLGMYSGNAGDSLSYHKQFNFATYDQDNGKNCAQTRHGAWWYKECFHSNLNGRYYETANIPLGERGISWNDFHSYEIALKFTQMMIRPRKN